MHLTATSVELRVGDRVLHDDVSFRIEGGKSLALMGPSGSGKSTLLSAIAGHRPITAGEIQFIGADSRDLAWLVQSTPLLNRRSVWDNVLLGARVANVPDEGLELQAKALLQDLAVAHLQHHPVHRLSGGERQRIAIARTILSQARIVLADEPTAALDVASREKVVDALLEVKRQGAILIVATHDEYVANACDAVFRL